MGASDTKVKTHLSCLNKSDKEMLYVPPPQGTVLKVTVSKVAITFNPIGSLAPKPS